MNNRKVFGNGGCVIEIKDRGIRDEPFPCGRWAQRYRLWRGLGSVNASLCADHLRVLANNGWTIEKLDSAGAIESHIPRVLDDVDKFQVAARSESENSLPFFK